MKSPATVLKRINLSCCWAIKWKKILNYIDCCFQQELKQVERVDFIQLTEFVSITLLEKKTGNL